MVKGPRTVETLKKLFTVSTCKSQQADFSILPYLYFLLRNHRILDLSETLEVTISNPSSLNMGTEDMKAKWLV